MRRLLNLLTLLFASLLAANCGGGGTPGTAAPPPMNPAAGPQVTGRVIDGETRQGIANAAVEYRVPGGGATGGRLTAADGSFSFPVPSGVVDSEVVDVTARAAGYVSTTLGTALIRASGTQIETILLVRESSTPGTISGTVLNARDGQGIGVARITLSRGQGITGDTVANSASDAQGVYAFTGLAAGTYTVSAFPTGFNPGTRTAITVSSGAVNAQDIIVSPVGSDPVVRIVLTWGREPADLDAHLTGPNPLGGSGRFHVYFANRLAPDAAPFAGLDLDNRSGFGPETITITRFNGGAYRYSVHDFTNRTRGGSTELGRSGARVEVYGAAGGTQSFYVPNQSGNLWTVFELSGDIASPTITPRNEMGFTEDFAGIL